MRIDHPQLAVGCCRELRREKAAAPNGGRNGHYQLFGSTSPTGSREERALKDLALGNATSMHCSRRGTTASLQQPGSWPSSSQSARKARRRKCGRSVAVGGIERRLFCATVVKQTAPYFAAWLGPHQVAVGVSASAEKLAFGIRAVLEAGRPDFARSLETGPQKRFHSTSSPEPF
jgi:hypothetical protein